MTVETVTEFETVEKTRERVVCDVCGSKTSDDFEEGESVFKEIVWDPDASFEIPRIVEFVFELSCQFDELKYNNKSKHDVVDEFMSIIKGRMEWLSDHTVTACPDCYLDTQESPELVTAEIEVRDYAEENRRVIYESDIRAACVKWFITGVISVIVVFLVVIAIGVIG